MPKNSVELYEEIFTPGAPVLSDRFLVGREQEKTDLRRVLRRRGQHAIVIGDRGVGKTTLVKYILRQQERPSVWHPASPNLRYSDVFRDLLENLGLDVTTTETTEEEQVDGGVKAKPLLFEASAGGSKKTIRKRRSRSQEELNPWTTFQYLQDQASDAIIVIDEYDALDSQKPQPAFHEGIAYTMKHLGDHSDECNARIIVVGVAYSAEALLGQHESVRRNAKEIFVKPLRYQDIYDFLDEAEDALSIKFERRVKQRIVRGSMGYPYFLHLIGQESVDAMLARSSKARTVEWADFKIAVNRAVESEMREAMQKFRSKSTGLTNDENTVLVELTWWQGYSASRQKFIEVLERRHNMKPSETNSVLVQLAQDRKFIYLSRHKDDIRFRDPLMKAFLREKIFTERGPKKDKFPRIDLPS